MKTLDFSSSLGSNKYPKDFPQPSTARFFLILALVSASGVLRLHGQGNCGILPPNQATSTHPDSIVYDRFGINMMHFLLGLLP